VLNGTLIVVERLKTKSVAPLERETLHGYPESRAVPA
jgi:hypothetical protein